MSKFVFRLKGLKEVARQVILRMSRGSLFQRQGVAWLKDLQPMVVKQA